MNILVLSDLHINAFDNFGLFQWHEMDLIKQIEKMRSFYSIDKVIFNGDVFELVKYSEEAIKKANPMLVEYFDENSFIFIRGNKDLLNNRALDHYNITNSKGQTIHIEHGHKAEWLNGTKLGRFLGRFGLTLLKKLTKYKLPMTIYFGIVAWQEEVNLIPKKYNTIKYLSYALRLLKKHDVVILGHTHQLESHHTYYHNQKKRYINTGDCSLGRFQGVIMNTETLQYELLKGKQDSIVNAYTMQESL